MTITDYANEREVSEHDALKEAFVWFHGREPEHHEFSRIFQRYLASNLEPGFVGLFLRHYRTGRMKA